MYEHPSQEIARRIQNECKAWHKKNAKKYLSSGTIFPRDIYSENPIVPSNDTDRFLQSIDAEALKDVIPKHELGYLSVIGKWMLFPSMREVDQVWKLLASNIRSGGLPYAAKVATKMQRSGSNDSEGDKHVICVYTENYFHREDVRSCRNKLRDLRFGDRLYYKPDIFTYKNLYRHTGSTINHRYFG